MEEESKKLNRLKIREFIDDLTNEELKSFILNYARNNAMFEMSMKAHFISRINIDNDGSKYKRLLDELIKPKTSSHNKIGATQVRTIALILKDFVSQMMDALSKEDYIEAYYLAFYSLSKITYLQHRYMIKNKSIEQSRIELLKGIDLILSRDLAPMFRSDAEKALKELVLKSYYLPQEINLISVLDANNCLTLSDKSELIESLIPKYKKVETYTHVLETLLLLAYPEKEEGLSIMNRFSHERIYVCLKSLIAKSNKEIVQFYLDPKKIGFNLNLKILELLLSINEQDYDQATRIINSIEPLEVPILELKEALNDIPDNYFVRYFLSIEKWVNNQQFDIKSALHARAQQYEKLIEILANHDDFEWIQIYDELLLEQGYKKELGELYFSIAENFISQHIGRKASAFLEKMNSRLIHLQQHRMLDSIHDKLYAQFSHRKSIKSILQQ